MTQTNLDGRRSWGELSEREFDEKRMFQIAAGSIANSILEGSPGGRSSTSQRPTGIALDEVDDVAETLIETSFPDLCSSACICGSSIAANRVRISRHAGARRGFA